VRTTGRAAASGRQKARNAIGLRGGVGGGGSGGVPPLKGGSGLYSHGQLWAFREGGGSYSGVNRIFLMGQEIGRGCEQSAAQQLRRTTEDAKRQRSKWEGAGWVLVEVAPPVKAWGCNPR
jgi:hypothetical protein